MDEEQSLIAITRLPEITENLRALREHWLAKAEEAGRLVCTDESVQSIKAMRTQMRKEYDEADRQRKAVKDRYMAAWNAVEATWKECVAEPFRQADASYKATVDGFEAEMKRRCVEDLRDYFDELCLAAGVDGLTFERAQELSGLTIGMADVKSKSRKRAKDFLAGFVSAVARDLEAISAMDDAAEVMVEYRKSYNIGEAMMICQARKRLIEEEREAAEARRTAQEPLKAAEAKVQAVTAPPVMETPVELEKRFERFTFTVRNVTKSDLIKIREFLKQEGIKYE